MTKVQIISLVVVLILTALGGFFIVKKSKKHDLVKWISLFFFLAVCLTWIFGYGYYSGTEFTTNGMHQQGITDIPYMLYQSIYFALDKVIFLLSLGVFYAVLSKCNGYKKLVHTIAEKFKGKEILFVLISSLFFALQAAFLSQNFIVLVFVPFVISIILAMKLDKLTAFSATFGSILVGMLGTIYGGEGLYYFNYYTNIAVTTGLLYRLIILVVAFVLFNFLSIIHIKKILKEKSVSYEDDDPFKVEKVKAHSWPIVVLFVLTFVLTILGYVSWNNNFGITIFNKFHEWLIGLKIGDFAVFKTILGSFASTTDNGAFGNWNLFHMSILLIVIGLIAAIINRVKLNEFIEAFGEGVKKLGLPIFLYLGSYMVMIAVYTSGTIPTITNAIFHSVSKFNPFLVALEGLLASVFHTDFGLTGFLVGGYLVGTYAQNVEVIHTIFTTMYGFVNLFIPTSGLLLIGLSYLNIDYKSWMKYIWIFAVSILVILLVLYTVMTYI